MLNDGFKETLIGPLPKEWEVLPLKDAVSYKKKSLNPQSYPEEEFDYYSIPAYAEFGRPIPEIGDAIRSQKLIVELGTVLFGKLNPRVPKIWHVSSDTHRRRIASTEFIPLKPKKNKSHDRFLYYLAWSEYLLPKSRELVSGSTPSRQRVDTKAFLDVLIPLPPLPEQHAIAQVLSTVREAIEATERVITAARDLKRSLMKYLFTYGPVPIDQADQVSLKETEIGEMPEEWEVVEIRDVASEVRSGATPRGGEKVYLKEGIPLIRSQNVLMNKLSLEDVAYISDEIHNSMLRSNVKPGDVLLNITGASIGRVTYVPEWVKIANVNQHVCRIRFTGGKTVPEYIAYYLSSEQGQENILGMQYGTTRQGLNFSQVRSILSPLPRIFEQEKIANYLIDIDNKIEAEKNINIH